MRRNGSSAQALLELAVMSTAVFILIGVLLQTGMNANYSDNVRMTGFRKAMQLAQFRGTTDGQDYNASLIVAQDRFVPAPGGGPGVASPVSAASSSSLAWTNKMYMIPTPAEMGNRDMLPRVDFEFNGVRYGPYTTAGWVSLGPYQWGTLFAIQEDVSGNGVWWQWRNVLAGEKDASGSYFIEAGRSADVDGDGVLELMVAVSRECPQENNCRVRRIDAIDPNAGDIDMTYTDDARPWVQGGLSPEYSVQQDSRGDFTRTHSGTAIHTHTDVTNRATVNRTIVAGAGKEIGATTSVPEVHVDFSYDGNF